MTVVLRHCCSTLVEDNKGEKNREKIFKFFNSKNDEIISNLFQVYFFFEKNSSTFVHRIDSLIIFLFKIFEQLTDSKQSG